MITIGIRAAPTAVTFAIYDSDSNKVVNIEQIKIPAAFSTPEGLKYVRSNLLDVLREYKVAKAGIRAAEPRAQSISIERMQIEGVIQEAFASSELTSYFVGHIASISSRLGIPRSDFKPFILGEKEYQVEKWAGMTAVQRESVLCAIGAVNV